MKHYFASTPQSILYGDVPYYLGDRKSPIIISYSPQGARGIRNISREYTVIEGVSKSCPVRVLALLGVCGCGVADVFVLLSGDAPPPQCRRRLLLYQMVRASVLVLVSRNPPAT